jgi:hypothetical protein
LGFVGERLAFGRAGCQVRLRETPRGDIRQFDSFHRIVPEAFPHAEVFEVAFRLNVFASNHLCVHKKRSPKAQRKKCKKITFITNDLRKM